MLIQSFFCTCSLTHFGLQYHMHCFSCHSWTATRIILTLSRHALKMDFKYQQTCGESQCLAINTEGLVSFYFILRNKKFQWTVSQKTLRFEKVTSDVGRGATILNMTSFGSFCLWHICETFIVPNFPRTPSESLPGGVLDITSSHICYPARGTQITCFVVVFHFFHINFRACQVTYKSKGLLEGKTLVVFIPNSPLGSVRFGTVQLRVTTFCLSLHLAKQTGPL